MTIAILLYNGITLLDAIGSYEVLSNLPDAKVFFVTKKRGDIKADTGFVTLKAKYNFKDVTEADILLIPGSTIAFVDVMKDEKTLDWIKNIDATTQFTTAVSSGSIILAKTGLLSGLHATSHWKTTSLLEEFNVLPLDRRVVKQGKYVTASGTTAGIDMALALCDELVGEDQTKAIQLVLEYNPKPIYNFNEFSDDLEIEEIAQKIIKKNTKREMGLLKQLKNRSVINKIK